MQLGPMHIKVHYALRTKVTTIVMYCILYSCRVTSAFLIEGVINNLSKLNLSRTNVDDEGKYLMLSNINDTLQNYQNLAVTLYYNTLTKYPNKAVSILFSR